MPSPEGRSRGGGEHGEPTGRQHLYLIFDDWAWGYSIRKLELPPPRSPHQPEPTPLLPMPPPCVSLEAPRGRPLFFAAAGTDIVAAHPRNDFSNSMALACFLPIVDVRSLGVRFGPGLLYEAPNPILIAVGDQEVFALGMDSFRMLPMKPPRTRYEWSWCDLPPPPLTSIDVISFAVGGSDGRTIFASTDRATFAFDTVSSEWKQSSDRSLPFAGRANYVHALDIFVGLSKAPGTYGHLCFCKKLGGGDEDVRLSKESLLSKDPGQSHLGATLVYLGGSDEPGFCLVECVVISITQGKSAVNMPLEEAVDEGGANCGELDQLEKNVDQEGVAASGTGRFGELDELKKLVDEGMSGSMNGRYLYRLTTFSLSFDNDGDLTTGETCVVQCYEVPEEVSQAIYLFNPVAFWL